MLLKLGLEVPRAVKDAEHLDSLRRRDVEQEEVAEPVDGEGTEFAQLLDFELPQSTDPGRRRKLICCVVHRVDESMSEPLPLPRKILCDAVEVTPRIATVNRPSPSAGASPRFPRRQIRLSAFTILGVHFPGGPFKSLEQLGFERLLVGRHVRQLTE
jgi:hypothetical protein